MGRRRACWGREGPGGPGVQQPPCAFKSLPCAARLFCLPKCYHLSASLVAQTVRNLPEMQETWVQSLSREDPLKKEMVTHSSILAWRISRTEESGRLQFVGLQRVGHD